MLPYRYTPSQTPHAPTEATLVVPCVQVPPACCAIQHPNDIPRPSKAARPPFSPTPRTVSDPPEPHFHATVADPGGVAKSTSVTHTRRANAVPPDLIAVCNPHGVTRI